MTSKARYGALERLQYFPLPIYTSPELEQTAQAIAARFTQGYHFLNQTLGTAPQVGLLILSVSDWAHHAAFPTYGLTHYDPAQRMVITAGQPTKFWRSVLDLVGEAHAPLLDELLSVYGQPDEHIDLAAHINLWVVHDLGHALHLDYSYWFPRTWLMEFFADLCLYSYIATNEPAQLSALETLPRVMSRLPARQFRYHTLHDFDTHYNGGMELENYLWYHGHLFEQAKHVFERSGCMALQRLWHTFVLVNIATVSDAQLIVLLRDVQPELDRLVAAWPEM